jgi:hypothetical protein
MIEVVEAFEDLTGKAPSWWREYAGAEGVVSRFGSVCRTCR